MDSHKQRRSASEEQKKREQERRWKRKEWHILQKLDEMHKERRAQRIEEFEKKRAEEIKVNCKQNFRRSKSGSPQRRKTSSSEHSKKWKSSMTIKNPGSIINDQKELHKLNINIKRHGSGSRQVYVKPEPPRVSLRDPAINNNRNLPTKNQNTSKDIEQDIIDPDSFVLPRRQNEGSCPIFDRSEIKQAEEVLTFKFSKDEQSEKQLPTNRKSAYRENRLQIIQHNTYCEFRSCTPTRHRNHQTDGNDRHTYDRRRGSPIRDSKEKYKDRNERRRRSSSRYSNRNAPVIRNRSRSRCRSRSLSPVNERVREKRADNDESKSLSRRNYSDRSRESDNCASSRSSTNYPPFCGFYNPYIVRLPGAMPMPRGPPMFMPRGLPMLMPVLPGPFPPMNIRWQQPPPKFANNKEINGNLR